jgi:hypothetical protein
MLRFFKGIVVRQKTSVAKLLREPSATANLIVEAVDRFPKPPNPCRGRRVSLAAGVSKNV